MSDHKVEELTSTYPKITFSRVEAHVIFAKLPEDSLLVYHMLGYALKFDNHVIHI